MANYYFPRVNTSFYAMTRTPATPEESNATILFAPLSATKGPENELTYVYSIAEYKEKFGNINFEDQGQQILNVCRWLNAGGVVAVYRMNDGYEPSISNGSVSGVVTTGEDYTKRIENEKIGLEISNNEIYWTINDHKTNIKVNKDTGIPIAADTTLTIDKTTGSTPKIVIKTQKASNTAVEYDTGINYSTKYASAIEQVSGFVLEKNETNNTYTVCVSVKDYSAANDEEVLCLTYPTNTSGDTLDITLPQVDVGLEANSINYKFKLGSAGTGINTGVAAPVKGVKANSSLLQGNTKINITSKYSGTYYNDLKVIIKPVLSTFKNGQSDGDSRFSVTIKKENTQLAYMNNVSKNTLYKFNASQEYIEIDLENFCIASPIRSTYTFSLSGGTDCVLSPISIIQATKTALAKPLESRVDVMLDAGYSSEIKLLLLEFFCGTEEDVRVARDDVTLYLDSYHMTETSRTDVSDELTFKTYVDGVKYDYFNANICAQYGKIEDIYSETEDIREIYVTPTYVYARLIPYNDATYGRQTPQAGLTYGNVNEFKWINIVPTDAEKNNYFADHVNYIEKDSRGYAFMSQLSATKENTNLDRINNGRVLNKIRNDIQDIARPYLYEILDATTIASLTNKLNSYMDSWKQNRTLSYYDLVVEADATNNNQLNVSLWITFKYCIEVIDVSIVVM